jgi:hypothetical protein
MDYFFGWNMAPGKNKNLTKASPTSCRYFKYSGVVPLDSRFHAVISRQVDAEIPFRLV